MIEKFIGVGFFPVASISDIRKGDVFRKVTRILRGPILLADSEPKQVPHPSLADEKVWTVKSKPHVGMLDQVPVQSRYLH